MKRLLIDKCNQSEIRINELVTQLRLVTNDYDLEDTISELELELLNKKLWLEQLNEL